MNSIFYTSTVFICLLVSQFSFGQEKKSGNIKSYFNLHIGANMDEEPVKSVTNEMITGFEIGLVKETIGNNEWEKLYNYPEYGISLFYTSLGNNKVFGQEIALVPFVKINLFSWQKLSIFGRIGMGFSYLNTITDPVLNPENLATSSHYNFHTNIRGGINYNISKKIEMNGGVSFDHISNGNIKKPNLGLNSISAYAGISYLLHHKKTKKDPIITPNIKHYNLFTYFGIGGKKSNFNSDYYILYSLTTELRKSLTKIFSLGVGTNIYWDPSILPNLKHLNKTGSSIHNLQTGLYISQSFRYNKLTISLQEGSYVFFNEKVKNNYFYTGANIEYSLPKNFIFRFTLKSHEFHILDHPGFALGYKF